jgi:hypothetical protein
MQTTIRPAAFRRSEQFPWFVLAAAVVTVGLASPVVLWFTPIEAMVVRLLGSLWPFRDRCRAGTIRGRPQVNG